MDLMHWIAGGLLALLPAVFWLVVYYQKDTIDPEPKKAIAQTFLAGMAVALLLLGLKGGLSKFSIQLGWLNHFGGIVALAALEEGLKLTASIRVVSRHRVAFNQLIDGAIYAIVTALGFAFVENAFYFIQFLKGAHSTEGLVALLAFRGIGTMLAHTLFSGLAGLVWAYAYFSKSITPFQKKGFLGFEWRDFFDLEILSLHIIRRNILEAHPSRRGGHEKKKLVLEGILLATLLHSLFNGLTTLSVMGQNLTFLLSPLVMIGFFLLAYQMTKKWNHQILKVI